MKQETTKKKLRESPKGNFRLIKNENYRERQQPKPRVKIVVEDLPPAA